MNKTEIGRQIREYNSGPAEALSCDKFGLEQRGGSRTKIDGVGRKDGKKWSIKNTKSRSTQVHLTTQKSFSEVFNLDENQREFVSKFFGNIGFTDKHRQRYKMNEISPLAVQSFKNFLENNKDKFIKYVVSGVDNIDYVAYNDYVLSFEEIMNICNNAHWVYNNTAIHLKNSDGKTLFHIQMKGSGKGTTYHGVLCHIHENLFKQNYKEAING